MQLFSYEVYNHTIQIDFPLNLHPTRSSNPDFSVFKLNRKITDKEYVKICSYEDSNNSGFCSLGRVDSDYALRFEGLVDFIISESRNLIRYYTATGIKTYTIEHLVLNQVIPRVLSRRNFLVLHAGAVNTNSGTIGFIGPTGSGKSTLTTYLGQYGYPIYSDDCLVLNPKEGHFLVFPSYPAVRLNVDMAKLLATDNRTTAVAEYTNKLRLDLSEEQYYSLAESSCLRAIFILEKLDHKHTSSSVDIVSCSEQEAFAAVIKNSFRLDPTDKQIMKKEFKQIAEMVSKVPIYRLQFPHRHDSLKQAMLIINSFFS